MAYRHVLEYYKVISKQYSDLLDELKDFSKEAEEGLVSPSQLENVQKLLQPLKENYERWAYMMYLWHLPNRDRKIPPYKERTKKFLENLDDKNSIESILKENEKSLDEVRKR